MKPADTDIPFIAVDFDGTMVDSVWPKRGVGKPLDGAQEKLQNIIEHGWTPIIHTARAWYDYDAIEAAMRRMGFPGTRIVCGKLLAAAYVDDRNIAIDAPVWHP